MAESNVAQRVPGILWWAGFPVAFMIWVLAPRESTIYLSFEPFSIEVNTLQTSLHPVINELVAGYRGTAVALAVLIAAAVLSHHRRPPSLRTSTLLLPVYVAGLEACIHLSWFGRRHHFTSARTLAEIRHEFQMATLASVIAVAAAVLVAELLLRFRRAGIAEPLSRRTLLPSVAVLASVLLLWLGSEQIYFVGPPAR